MGQTRVFKEHLGNKVFNEHFSKMVDVKGDAETSKSDLRVTLNLHLTVFCDLHESTKTIEF